MAKQSKLASLSISALVKMRDEIGSILSRRAELLKYELRAIGEDYKEVGRIVVYGRQKTGKVESEVSPPQDRRNLGRSRRTAPMAHS